MNKDFQKRVKTFLTDQDKLAKRLNLVVRLTVYFPGKKKPPILSRIALSLARAQGAVLDTQFTDTKK